MSDHEIRTLLQGMAEDVQDVRPLGHKALRRTRTRRLAVAATVVTSVLTIAVGGAGLALDAGPFRDDGAVAPIGPGDSTPLPPREMPGTIVAYGTSEDGTEWWLSAYEDEAGKLCVDLQHDGRIAEDCSFYDPEGTGLGRDPEHDVSPQNVFGWVPDDTDKAWVTWAAEVYMDEGPEDDAPEEEDDSEDGVARGSNQDDGGVATGSDGEDDGVATGSDQDPGVATGSDHHDDDDGNGGGAPGPNIDIRGDEEVRLFDAPEGFPFPVKFYALVPAPDDASALRVDFRNGNASVVIFSHRPADLGEEPAGELVAEGEYHGYAWELYARTSGDERCLDLIWADEEFGAGGSCSTAVPRAESFQFSQLRFGDRHSQTVAFIAAMTGDVARMEMTLEEGETIGIEIMEGPEGSEIDYAVEWPPPGEDGVLRGSVTSYDDAGNVLDTMQLCELSEPNSSCGSDSPPP